MQRIEAVIFDLDGTLIDTMGFYIEAWDKVMRRRGIELSEDELLQTSGVESLTSAKEAVKKYNFDDKPIDLVNERIKIVEKWFRQKEIKTKEYVIEALDYFTKNEVKIALATSGRREETPIKTSKAGIDIEIFVSVLTRDDVDKHKPDPEVYLSSAKNIEVDIKNCLVFEDSESGVNAAKNAGAVCIAVKDKYSVNHDLSRADKVFDSLKEAMSWVKDNFDF